MLNSAEKRLKEKYSNYTDGDSIRRLHIHDPQNPMDALITFDDDSDEIWDYAESAKEKYPDNTIVVEQIQRQWIVFGSDPTEDLTQTKEVLNNYRIIHHKHERDIILHFTSLRACICYLLDNFLLHDCYKLEVYDRNDDIWKEWMSLKGRLISHIRG